METTDNSATSSPAPGSTARRSGRVTKVPDKFVPHAPTATKRKRDAEHGDEDGENESPDDDVEAEDDDVDDSDADEEEERYKKVTRKKASSQTTRVKKSAVKKPKVNGTASTGASHTSRLPSRPKKTVRISVEQRDGDGLYAKIFGSGESSDKVATDWYHEYQVDDAAAVTDLVNCLLLSAGCSQHVTADDIRDPENCQNRLADLQNVYTEVGITDYPLISRTRTTRPFRELLIGFFRSLVNIMHETDVLYEDTAIMENIATWVGSMSSSTLRPFRHTATTVALAMETALVEVSKKLDDRITKTTQQLDAEKRRKGKNKERISAIQKNLQEAAKCSEYCQGQITDFFDIVFVHRYRDVDPKLRTECAEALGTWVWTLPTMFMKPEYLRYLGWMLSDVVPATRHEVLRQLARLFKRDTEKLGHFIDRFRARLVEMATRDMDVGVRVAAIDVIAILKNTGMLEPDDVDSVGMLVFDSEPRVRRAVTNFFADCVNDAIDAKIEALGGNDAIDEIFGDDQEDEYEAPRRDWVSIKCLAEILSAYEAQLEEGEKPDAPRRLDIAVETVQPVAALTRVSIASQVLCEKIEHIRNWELLTGYLLYDHSASSKSKSRGQEEEESSEAKQRKLRDLVAPEGREESLLVEVLSSSVKLSMTHTVETEKGKKKSRVDVAESREDSAMRLVNAIPRLLRKFGSESSTAVLILQLLQLLDMEALQQLRQDASAYSRLLDEIYTQFNRHVDRGVVFEASLALTRMREHDELEEATDDRISSMWESVINSLRNFDKLTELTIRGSLDGPALSELGNVLMKVSRLVTVSSCVDVLEAGGQSEDSSSPAIELLVRIVHRGRLAVVDEELDDLEDEVVAYAIKSCYIYFRWKQLALTTWIQAQAHISTQDVAHLNALRATYAENLVLTFSSRGTNDDLRLFATGYYCDLFATFAAIREAIEQAPDGSNKYASLSGLVEVSDPSLISELIEIFEAAEAGYAKRAKKALNEPAEDEDPIDVDDTFSDDEESQGTLTRDERKAREIRTEKVLCDLTSRFVMAIRGRMIDCTGPQPGRLRKRMLRNQNKLGPYFKDVLSFLDEDKIRERGVAVRGGAGAGAGVASKKKVGAARGRAKPPAAGGRKKPLSEEVIVADDDGDDEDHEEVMGPLVEDTDPEEGTVEDLRRRELLDDPIDDEQESGDDRGAGGADDAMEEDSVLGD